MVCVCVCVCVCLDRGEASAEGRGAGPEETEGDGGESGACPREPPLPPRSVEHLTDKVMRHGWNRPLRATTYRGPSG